MQKTTIGLVYVGIDRDGRFVCAARPDMPHLAKELAKWRRGGLAIVDGDDGFVRRHFGDIVVGVENEQS